MEAKLKRRKSWLILGFLGLFFVIILISANFLLFIVENQINPEVSDLNDSFRIVENIFKFGNDDLSAITLVGRMISLVTFSLVVILFIIFVVQVLILISSLFMRPYFRSVKQDFDKEGDVFLDKIRETQKIEDKILQQQHQILQKEENIIEKLDRLRYRK
ncbi:hypothetical protein A2533_01460 [Candidatus Falkowbacteria bacterium RIFOXYD2_FULL_35_9]|uniref:Uncharacterized protein n=1 Tax=Candidatus Falkowbacteria bacterium RIFOXYC2_FULL_36_12 TaxID=1798002 RepID=A0A1F5SW47_9BACT|nr:MAG: hypothetical protein A2478_00725 [Candidatus Falkowbacteria bacterium RIFOXYC2_FULL_36_12]OGF34383.1 MAG: hypothetical protein A2223_02525 [Candidatus Falkowbacteria bacterium RIFOXYA2_FULL_35_8]OGF45886.1 MAG: hypothetical protein A2533_01460 [Candidatus Falkowbacteria bacterium RIFOXYD2_FULL_35_9]